jgi:hypothetical protein
MKIFEIKLQGSWHRVTAPSLAAAVRMVRQQLGLA